MSLDKKTIYEGNLMIAEYQGGKIKKQNNKTLVSFQSKIVSATSLRYHTSWNALMPVWLDIVANAKSNEDDCRNGRFDYMLPSCEVHKHSVFITPFIWHKKWHEQSIFHSCFQYDNGQKESDDMMECYWKSIVDFLKFKNNLIKDVRGY